MITGETIPGNTPLPSQGTGTSTRTSLPQNEVDSKVKEAAGARLSTEQEESATSPLSPGRVSVEKVDPVESNNEERQAIAQRQGHIWDCTGRRPHHDGVGFIYTFQMKAEYFNDDWAFRKKQNEIHPAIEPNRIPPLNENFDTYFSPDLISLGFKRKSTPTYFRMEVPDREALLHEWEKLRQRKPWLPELHIAPSKGVASDMEFVEANIKYDVLWSDGMEFFHDAYFHVLPTIRRMMEGNYANYQKYYIEDIKRQFNAIKLIERLNHLLPENKRELVARNIELMQLTLGFCVDAASTLPSCKERSKFISGNFTEFFREWENLTPDSNFHRYLLLQKRGLASTPDDYEIITADMDRLIIVFDKFSNSAFLNDLFSYFPPEQPIPTEEINLFACGGCFNSLEILANLLPGHSLNNLVKIYFSCDYSTNIFSEAFKAIPSCDAMKLAKVFDEVDGNAWFIPKIAKATHLSLEMIKEIIDLCKQNTWIFSEAFEAIANCVPLELAKVLQKMHCKEVCSFSQLAKNHPGKSLSAIKALFDEQSNS